MQPTDDKQLPVPQDSGSTSVPDEPTKLVTSQAALPMQATADNVLALATAQANSSPSPMSPNQIPIKTPPKPIAVIDAPATAEDDDLIEQEWVNKAKAIVERNRDDPHQQNEEMSKFKADYMKKRYNRDVKIAED